jgi:hypothetical protein
MVLKPNLRVDYKQSSSHGLGGTTQLTQFFLNNHINLILTRKNFQKNQRVFYPRFIPG